MKKVLVVDDSQSMRNIVAGALAPAGFMVIEASDGAEGLKYLAEHTDVDLVILDLNMPGMGGMEMLERLRKELPGRSTPVLMLTTEAERTLMERAKAAGAKGWLIKPVKPDLLVGAVTKLTR